MFLKRGKIILFSIIAFITCIISLSTVQSAAWANMCSSTGSANMGKIKNANAISLEAAQSPLKDVVNRKYTGIELFEQSVNYAIVNGDRNDNDWFRANRTSVIDILEAETTPNQEAIDRVKQTGQNPICVLGGFSTTIQSTFLGITKFLAKITADIIQIFFDNSLICDGSGKSCYIDLIKIGGGTEGGNGGIIGQLTRGVFMPMSIFAFISVALWLLYNALWKGELRKGLGGLLWALMSFFVGLVIMVAPVKIAKIPQQGVNLISSCIFNVMTGGSCLDSGEKLQEQQKEQFCTAYGDTDDPNLKNQFVVNSLSCNIIKGIAIDRWSKQQFGRTFNELYTMNAPDGYSVVPPENLAGKPEDYCVSMFSVESALSKIQSSYSGTTPKFTDGNGNAKVCNIAAAYLANATIGNFGETSALTQQYESKDSRIVTGQSYVMATLAKNEDMWNAMTGSGRDFIGLFGVLSALFTALVFLPVVLSGLSFKFISMITIMLSPVFILFSIHPGKGKKIFLGWLQGFLSALMKYFAVGILVIVMTNIYSAAFANLNGTLLLIVSMVLALTFISYRKEIVDLLGKVDLGGTRLSNALGDRLDKIKDKAGDYGKATVAGGIAGAVTGQGIASGITEGVAMQASRGSGLIASGVRTARRLNNQATSLIEKTNRDINEANRNAENKEFLNNLNRNNQINNESYGSEENKQYLENDLSIEESRMREMSASGLSYFMKDLKDEVHDMSPEDVQKHSEDINRRKDMLSSLNDNVVKDGVFKGKRNFVDSEVNKAQKNIDSHASTIENETERNNFLKENSKKIDEYRNTLRDSIQVSRGEIQNVDTKKMLDFGKNFEFGTNEKSQNNQETAKN